ncbi:FecR family protein [Pedobacter sp. ok626]|uniref:FecR family protein n=1 Tax=Pedobacter sp. ok626 TaxID=1761882 RepID=UPI00088BC59E|nr:FecR family protein [Pedobacter sp. ok626]SDJ51437.1 FecR family protein [Pedobacter sp. ok626]
MQDTRFNYLFEQYYKGLATPEESNEFLNIVEDDLNKNQVHELMEVYWKNAAAEDVEFFSERQRNRMFEAVLDTDQDVKKKAGFKIWPRLAGIAAAAAIIIAGTYLIFNNNKTKDTESIAQVSDIAPGKVGATLTLADGKKISLEDAQNGELANEAGISINKTADGQVVYQVKGNSGASDKINTLTTAKGETYMLTLPDKSKVWINAASSLSYSASLNKQGLRKVKLQGEAYFEIFKDKAHPFIVQTDNQEVEVLGTHFNVNSYNDEPGIATTLMEGSVKIISGGTQKIIKPGEQAINRSGAITVNLVNLETVTDWKNGDFNLDKVNFKVAMRKIARWYNVEVIYDPSITDDMEAGGWVSRQSNLSSILNVIESSGLVRFKVDGRKVFVYK